MKKETILKEIDKVNVDLKKLEVKISIETVNAGFVSHLLRSHKKRLSSRLIELQEKLVNTVDKIETVNKPIVKKETVNKPIVKKEIVKKPPVKKEKPDEKI